MQLLTRFDGCLQIPDVDAVVHTADFPCVKKSPDTVDYKRPYEHERVGSRKC